MDEMQRDCEEYIHWVVVLLDLAGECWSAEQQRMKTYRRIREWFSGTAADLSAVLDHLDTTIGLPDEAPDMDVREKEVKRLGWVLYCRLTGR